MVTNGYFNNGKYGSTVSTVRGHAHLDGWMVFFCARWFAIQGICYRVPIKNRIRIYSCNRNPSKTNKIISVNGVGTAIIGDSDTWMFVCVCAKIDTYQICIRVWILWSASTSQHNQCEFQDQLLSVVYHCSSAVQGASMTWGYIHHGQTNPRYWWLNWICFHGRFPSERGAHLQMVSQWLSLGKNANLIGGLVPSVSEHVRAICPASL